MENLEFLQDKALKHMILVEILLRNVGQQGGHSMSIVTHVFR